MMRVRGMAILPPAVLAVGMLVWVAAAWGAPLPAARGVEPEPRADVMPDSVAADNLASDSVALDSVAPAGVTLDSVAPDSVAGVGRGEISSKLLQVKVTAVDIDREKPQETPLHYYDKHGNPLETPVRFLAELDTVTVKVKAGPKYPAFGGVTIGVNFFDGIMMIAGQRRGSFDLSAECSVHNWFFPIVEAGVGVANARPEEGRSHYRINGAPYVRVGMNYNFLYKSNPDYQVYLGLRAGWSSFGYDITEIQAGSEYYMSDGPTEMTGLRSTAWYGQVLAGLKVKIAGPFSLGWSVRYGFNLKQTYSNADYPAWFTPGKGTSTPITATFSALFSF